MIPQLQQLWTLSQSCSICNPPPPAHSASQTACHFAHGVQHISLMEKMSTDNWSPPLCRDLGVLRPFPAPPVFLAEGASGREGTGSPRGLSPSCREWASDGLGLSATRPPCLSVPGCNRDETSVYLFPALRGVRCLGAAHRHHAVRDRPFPPCSPCWPPSLQAPGPLLREAALGPLGTAWKPQALRHFSTDRCSWRARVALVHLCTLPAPSPSVSLLGWLPQAPGSPLA